MRVRLAMGALIALAVLGGALRYAHVHNEDVQRIVSAVHGLESSDEQTMTQLLAVLDGVELNVDPIMRARREASEHVATLLAQAPFVATLIADFPARIATLRGLFHKKATHIDDLLSSTTERHASRAALFATLDALEGTPCLAAPDGAAAAVRAVLRRLASPAAVVEPLPTGTLERLGGVQSPPCTLLLASFALHARTVLLAEELLLGEFDDVVMVPTGAHLERLRSDVAVLEEMQLRRFRYFGLGMFTLVLVAGLLIYGLFLRLEREAIALEDANTHLERRVREQTGHLERTNEELRLDIERRQRAEGERDRMELQLRQAQKLEAVGMLASGVAHEINTPVQYVGDNIRFLQDALDELLLCVANVDDALAETPAGVGSSVRAALEAADVAYLKDEGPRAIQQSLEGVDRVATIVRSLKSFAHPGTQRDNLDVNAALESTLTVARNEWKYVADVATDLDPALPLVPCLPGEINQCLLNIIVNAAHAIGDVVGDGGEAKGRIAVQTRAVDGAVEIAISDTGCGIPDDIRSRIFDPFFTTKEVGKGTGQGLSIAYNVVVANHGGTLTVDSEVGCGTTFRIRLPLASEATGEEGVLQ